MKRPSNLTVALGGSILLAGSLLSAPVFMSLNTTESCSTGSEAINPTFMFDVRVEALTSYLYRGSADLGAPGWDPDYGWGRLDAWGAFVVAYGDVNDDRGIDLQDTLTILQHFGEGGPNQPYNRYDINYGPDNTNAGVDLADALASLQVFGLNACLPLHGGFQTPSPTI